MLRRLRRMIGYRIRTTDGSVGTVSDFHFEDHTWRIRHMVADVGWSLTGRRALIPARRVGLPNDDERSMEVTLTKAEVKSRPSVETAPPVYRQRELSGPPYGRPPWGFPSFLIGEAYPVFSGFGPASADWDPHLRSVREVAAYAIQAADGHVGYVEDFLARVDNWAILHVLVRIIMPQTGRRVLVPARRFHHFDWDRRLVRVDLTSAEVRCCPCFSLGPVRPRRTCPDLHVRTSPPVTS